MIGDQMRVIVVGCGRVGSTLAYQLYKKGHKVVVIDKDVSAFDNLPLDFRGRTIEGDALAQNVLHRAEVDTADALAAVTNSDSLNALVAHIARTEYRVAKVVARNYDPTQRPLQEAFNISIVGSAGWGAQRIEELLSNDPLRLVFLDSNTKFALYQLEVNQNWHGRSMQDLLPAERIKVVEMKRTGKPLQVSGAQTMECGDLIYLSAEPNEIEALRQRLGSHQE
jgi:trk system potassium uptake protein TrkA